MFTTTTTNKYKTVNFKGKSKRLERYSVRIYIIGLVPIHSIRFNISMTWLDPTGNTSGVKKSAGPRSGTGDYCLIVQTK